MNNNIDKPFGSVRIYESKNRKLLGLASTIFLISLGLVFGYLGDYIGGAFFLISGIVLLVKAIRQLKAYPVIIEYDEEKISLPVQKDHITVYWSDIQRAERKFAPARMGIVPSYILIYLRSGQKLKVSLPYLTVEEDDLVGIINSKAFH